MLAPAMVLVVGKEVPAVYLMVDGGEASNAYDASSSSRCEGDAKRTGCDDGGGVMLEDIGGGDARDLSVALRGGEEAGGVEGTTATPSVLAMLAVSRYRSNESTAQRNCDKVVP